MFERVRRRLGWAALIAGALVLLVWPFYASAYFATPDGAEFLEPSWVQVWHDPFRDAAEPLLTFSDPHTVYVTYGKVLTFVFVGFLAGLVGLHAWQRGPERKLERVAHWTVFTATAMFAVGSLFIYWTPARYWDAVVEYAFVLLAIPAVLVSLVGYPLLGWATVRARVAPPAVGWLLGLGALPGIPLLTFATGSLTGGLAGLGVAWVAAGVALVRRGTATGAAVQGAPPDAASRRG